MGAAVADALAALIGPEDIVQRDAQGRYLLLVRKADLRQVDALLQEL